MSSEVDAAKVISLRDSGALKEALLAEPLGDKVGCNICQRRCVIARGGVGYCKTIINYNGILYTTIYGVISSASADPIEKKPVFHYRPGSRCFSVGTLGCNFRCVFCQNWEIAYADAAESQAAYCKSGITPERLVELAEETGSEGVSWTYNEPSIWLNYTLDCAKACKKAGLYTVYVTNGYATPEGLDVVGPYLDVYRVDIKSMRDDFYIKMAQVPSVQGILDVAVQAKQKWSMHLECVTNIIPGLNDDEDNLADTANWIAKYLGNDTPWHVTRFFPYGELSNVLPTPPETLLQAQSIGKQCGLKFVYLGNTATDTGENTYCPKCGALNVKRSGYKTQLAAIDNMGRCSVDGEYLNIKV